MMVISVIFRSDSGRDTLRTKVSVRFQFKGKYMTTRAPACTVKRCILVVEIKRR